MSDPKDEAQRNGTKKNNCITIHTYRIFQMINRDLYFCILLLFARKNKQNQKDRNPSIRTMHIVYYKSDVSLKFDHN